MGMSVTKIIIGETMKSYLICNKFTKKFIYEYYLFNFNYYIIYNNFFCSKKYFYTFISLFAYILQFAKNNKKYRKKNHNKKKKKQISKYTLQKSLNHYKVFIKIIMIITKFLYNIYKLISFIEKIYELIRHLL